MAIKRIVITGIGIVSPLGRDPQTFWDNISNGKSAIKEISLFDVSSYRSHRGADFPEFNPKSYLGEVKGLRYWDRVSLFAASAAKLALKDAWGDKTPYSPADMGVVLGSTYGTIGSISAFDTISIKEGPIYVSPMEFPNTVLNGPAGRVAIEIEAKGLNSTLSTGETSGLDAMIYASDFLRMDRVKGVLAGGAFAITPEVFWGFYTSKAISGSKTEDAQELCAPFDKRRNGIILGEGAVFFFLEDLERAKNRGAKIYGEILGAGFLFNPAQTRDNKDISGGKGVIDLALTEANLRPQDISYVAGAANSSASRDAMESKLINEFFGNRAQTLPVSAIKSMTGECLDSSGPFQALAGLLAIKNHMVPPTVNYEEKDPECDLDCVPNKARNADIDYVLVHSYTCAGHCTAMVLGGARD